MEYFTPLELDLIHLSLTWYAETIKRRSNIVGKLKTSESQIDFENLQWKITFYDSVLLRIRFTITKTLEYGINRTLLY